MPLKYESEMLTATSRCQVVLICFLRADAVSGNTSTSGAR